jgi:hypothetical protein
MSTTYHNDHPDAPLIGNHNLPHRWDTRHAMQPDIGTSSDEPTRSRGSRGRGRRSGSARGRRTPQPRMELPAFIAEWEKETKDRKDREAREES